VKALITGSDGFVGRHLIDHLRQQNIETVPFDIRRGHDLRDYEQIRAAIEQAEPDYIFHLAAQADVPEGGLDPRRALETNTIGTFNLLEAVRNTRCQARVLLAGSAAEYGIAGVDGIPVTEETAAFPVEPYGVSKLAATHLGLVYAARYGLRVVVTRAYNHTGPGRPSRYVDAAFARRIVAVERGRLDIVTHGDLSAVRNFTDVRDVVRAYRLAVELDSGIYNVCSDVNLSIHQVLDTLVDLATIPIQRKLDPALSASAQRDIFYPPSCVKLAAATGWEPTIPTRQTFQDLLNWWRQQ
jgi:GDP-4-dehydro-6-deoxy-D-mannose reductase